MSNKLRIISISDIHGCYGLFKSCGDVISNADAVLISGDLTNFGGKEEAETVIKSIREFNDNIYAVTGNCDTRETEEYLEQENINLNKRIIDINGVKILGFNGSLTTPCGTPNEFTADYYEELIQFYNKNYPESGPVIFVSHQPPFETLCDSVNDRHVGCKALTAFIEEKQPLACFCGHIHDADGIDQIGNTYIMNPGRFDKGGAILAEIDLNAKEAALTFIELFEK